MKTLLILFVFISFGLKSQDVITLQEIDYGGLVLIEIQDFPEEKISGKCSGAYLLFDGENETFSFVGKQSEETYKIFSAIPGTYIFNHAKAYFDVVFSNDTIKVCSEMPFRATTYCHTFVYKKNTFVFVDTEENDPSWENVQAGEDFLLNGKIKEAVESFSNVMYPHAYMDERDVAVRLLFKAHELALIAYKEKNYKKAAEIFGYAYDYWFLDYETTAAMDEELGYLEFYSAAAVVNAFGDYGLFLYKAGEKEKSIEVNLKVVRLDPQTPGPFLQLGDAYFDIGKKEEAVSIYEKYSNLMKKKGLETKIPTRVKERVK